MFLAGLLQGCLSVVRFWLDWEKEFEDALEVPQIVGHTRCAKPTQKGRSYCIDFTQGACAIVQNGELQLNIWPDSWLGEEMLKSVEN